MDKLQVFENQQIRSVWDEEKEEWYFSVIDLISVLTGSQNPRRYWSDLKRKLSKEGASQLYENIVQLKLESARCGSLSHHLTGTSPRLCNADSLKNDFILNGDFI